MVRIFCSAMGRPACQLMRVYVAAGFMPAKEIGHETTFRRHEACGYGIELLEILE